MTSEALPGQSGSIARNPGQTSNTAAEPRTKRPQIYELFPRLFGNTNETRQPNGTLAQNGVGKFRDITVSALRSLREMGFTHVWLLGIPRHASATDYSQFGIRADTLDILKGIAGSPYAIRDYFDVCPDYAEDPARRLEEFQELVGRIHDQGLQVIIDFVPNHVARSYRSVIRPELSLGAQDDRSCFFAPNNNFYYLEGEPPLRLPGVEEGRMVSPTCQVLGGCEGLFKGEKDHGKVTGNNVSSWRPNLGDWYDTVKLNYGFDFRQGRDAPKHLPTIADPEKPVPNTWVKMDAVIDYWQSLGVDGFRCDMAHWVPLEFWKWALERIRQRNPSTLMIAEAYDDDSNKLTEGNVLKALLDAGFDAVYDHQGYRVLKEVYDGPKWANDLDQVIGSIAPMHRSVRYAENHDEVRLANTTQWGGNGAAVGRPVSSVLFGIGRGPLLVYNGQEVGEPALGTEGFANDNARTTIFDYWCMPELAKWVNAHRYDGERLSEEQKELRSWYGRLLTLTSEPAFARGEFIPLNPHNVQNPRFGRLPGEAASGHWLYAFIRSDRESGQRFVIVANFHGKHTMREVSILLSREAADALANAEETSIEFRERLSRHTPLRLRTTSTRLREEGIVIPSLPPLSAFYLQFCALGIGPV